MSLNWPCGDVLLTRCSGKWPLEVAAWTADQRIYLVPDCGVFTKTYNPDTHKKIVSSHYQTPFNPETVLTSLFTGPRPYASSLYLNLTPPWHHAFTMHLVITPDAFM